MSCRLTGSSPYFAGHDVEATHLERLRSRIELYISTPANPGRLRSLKPANMALVMRQLHLTAPITFTLCLWTMSTPTDEL
ncbi:hypothetical protein GGP41_005061 [Bipolaris sorokiniana]|uniref:Uncharacterized protein n=1 Tax=Cochliobolus sativus TaxID=45130 RepID=A0A8H6DV56_COCSA|nr:hypothetical protein GGP41_005061 [Bipolaris sorokiniana]